MKTKNEELIIHKCHNCIYFHCWIDCHLWYNEYCLSSFITRKKHLVCWDKWYKPNDKYRCNNIVSTIDCKFTKKTFIDILLLFFRIKSKVVIID